MEWFLHFKLHIQQHIFLLFGQFSDVKSLSAFVLVYTEGEKKSKSRPFRKCPKLLISGGFMYKFKLIASSWLQLKAGSSVVSSSPFDSTHINSWISSAPYYGSCYFVPLLGITFTSSGFCLWASDSYNTGSGHLGGEAKVKAGDRGNNMWQG